MLADAVRIADQQDWPLAATIEFLYQQADFNDLVHQLETSYASKFSGAENMEAPGYPAKIYFTDGVPSGAATLIAASGLPIRVYLGATETAQEIEAHSHAVADELDLQGYTDFLVSYDTDGTIEVTIGGGDPIPVLPSAIAYNVVFSQVTGPVTTEDNQGLARGGMWAYDAGYPSCTTGFNVYHVASGVTGTTTSAHCGSALWQGVDDLSTIILEHPGIGGAHYGTLGDLQWYKTWQTAQVGQPNLQDAPDTNSIWWNYDERRAITRTELSITKNSYYCKFGRQTGDACDSVRRVSVSKNGVRKLVMVHYRQNTGGDSGGPWFRTEWAAGLHHGAAVAGGSWRDLFSPAHLLDDAIGVRIKYWEH